LSKRIARSWKQRWTLVCTALGVGVTVLLGGLVGCASKPGAPAKPTPETPGSPVPAGSESAAERPGKSAPRTAAPIKLGPPERPRDWQHARLQAAQRMVAAHPDGSYLGQPPDVLLAIPVLSVELNGDGSVRRISVMRYPGQARDTVELAMAAIRKAAPYGDVSKLPKPWKFNETFLFDQDRRFKPMSLDR